MLSKYCCRCFPGGCVANPINMLPNTCSSCPNPFSNKVHTHAPKTAYTRPFWPKWFISACDWSTACFPSNVPACKRGSHQAEVFKWNHNRQHRASSSPVWKIVLTSDIRLWIIEVNISLISFQTLPWPHRRRRHAITEVHEVNKVGRFL